MDLIAVTQNKKLKTEHFDSTRQQKQQKHQIRYKTQPTEN